MNIDNNIRIDRDLEPLVSGFMERRLAELPQMEKFYADRNFEEFKKLGHKLKGSCLNYGFGSLGKLAAQMEEAAVSKNEIELRDLIDTIKNHINNVNITFVDSQSEQSL